MAMTVVLDENQAVYMEERNLPGWLRQAAVRNPEYMITVIEYDTDAIELKTRIKGHSQDFRFLCPTKNTGLFDKLRELLKSYGELAGPGVRMM